MRREQRRRLVLGTIQLGIAVVVLIVLLIDGSRWYGWLIMTVNLLSGMLKLLAYRQGGRDDGSGDSLRH